MVVYVIQQPSTDVIVTGPTPRESFVHDRDRINGMFTKAILGDILRWDTGNGSMQGLFVRSSSCQNSSSSPCYSTAVPARTSRRRQWPKCETSR